MSTPSAQLEALLFTAGEAVPFSDLAELTKLSEAEVVSTLQDMQKHYEDRGIAIIISDTHAQITTNPIVSEFLAQFTNTQAEQLSKAAMETLSIIAYRGPIARFDIDAIRGVDSRRMVRQLFTRGFIRQIRSSGKAVQYDVTEEFLLHMGISEREQLPSFAELSTNENLSHITNPTS